MVNYMTVIPLIIFYFFSSMILGDTRRVEELLKRANVDVIIFRNDDTPMYFFHQVNGIFAGHTPLQAAAQNGHLDIIRLLIQNSVNLEIEV